MSMFAFVPLGRERMRVDVNTLLAPKKTTKMEHGLVVDGVGPGRMIANPGEVSWRTPCVKLMKIIT